MYGQILQKLYEKLSNIRVIFFKKVLKYYEDRFIIQISILQNYSYKGESKDMKKKLLALVLSLGVVIGTVTTAFAAPSASTGTSTTSEGYTVSDMAAGNEAYDTLKAEQPEVADIIDKVNAGEMTIEEFAAGAGAEFADVLAGKESITGFVDVTGTPDENGKYNVVLHNPVFDSYSSIYVIHYDMTNNAWEVVEAAKGEIANTITFTLDSLSPICVVGEKAAAGTDAEGTKSPATGMSSNAALFGVLAGACAIVVVAGAKKKNTK